MGINWLAINFSILAGLATALGALPVFFKREFSKTSLDVGMGFSAGIMLVASFVSLILPAVDAAKAIYAKEYAILPVLMGLGAGYLFIITVHDLLPHEHIFKKSDMGHGKKVSRVFLIVMAVALHNFPEGLAVGVGLSSGGLVGGGALALAIAIQNIPEGLVVAFGVLSEGSSRKKAFMMALLSGLVEPVAAFLGFLSTKIATVTLPIALGFAGGTMLFVICQEIFPEIFRQGHERKATFGVISGVISMMVINYYL